MIDNEGRLFGKINILDFMIIALVLIFSIRTGYYFWRINSARMAINISNNEIEFLKEKYGFLEKALHLTFEEELNKLTADKQDAETQRDEKARQIKEFLREHKRARRYFE